MFTYAAAVNEFLGNLWVSMICYHSKQVRN